MEYSLEAFATVEKSEFHRYRLVEDMSISKCHVADKTTFGVARPEIRINPEGNQPHGLFNAYVFETDTADDGPVGMDVVQGGGLQQVVGSPQYWG
jgi:hypothetical protein